MVLRCMIMTIALFLNNNEALAQCYHGEIRLVNGSLPNEGRVEVCACSRSITSILSCSWGTVCDDYWDYRDAQVVCRQLGYTPDGAMAIREARYYGQGRGDIFLDNVHCDGSEATLLECNHYEFHDCLHSEDAGVKCNGDENIIKNISASIASTTLYTALITWSPQNTTVTQYQPNFYKIECFNRLRQHHIRMLVNNTTFNLELAGLLPFMSYTCCVSTIYGSYTARRVCSEIATIQSPTSQPSETPMMPSNGGPTVISGDISTNKPTSESSIIQPRTCQTQESSLSASSSANTIGGVLGFIIAILLILLALSGAAVVYLLRLKLKSSVAADRSSTDVPLRANMSYTTTPSHSTTSGPHATQATRPGHSDQTQIEGETTDEYSRIGPSYTYVTAQVRRQQPATVAGRNRVSVSAAELSERYEFSEAHLTAAGGGHGDDGTYGVLGGEVGGDVQRHNIQIEERDKYSHLQY